MNGLDAWVYREGKRTVSGRALMRDLERRIGAGRSGATSALVSCGIIESALADVAHPAAAQIAAVTDHLACVVIGRNVVTPAPLVLDVPERLVIGTPEGFSYYGVTPAAYARAVAALDVGWRALVIGIRSIGTTLSAVVAAALAARGVDASRITVRPTGPVYDRRVALALPPGPWSDVFVVDEGPGVSGSTFLAAAEAVVACGVPCKRVTLVTNHDVEPGTLAAPRAAERWRRFRAIVACSPVPVERRDRSAAKASSERRKLLAGGRLYTFGGLGPSGDAVRARADALADAGWSPPMREEGDGWVSSPWIRREPPPRLETVARYCAERVALCPAAGALEDLDAVTKKNVSLLLGHVAGVAPLEVVRPAIVDARMDPHEWSGAIKHDAAAGGDAHVFPGPTDIAWDLAGAIVEHGLDRDAFLRAYERASGDDARARIDAWVVAYASFRGAVAALAAVKAGHAGERARLRRAVARYRGVCSSMLRATTSTINRSTPFRGA